MSRVPVGKDKSGSRAAVPQFPGQFQMLPGRFKLLVREGKGQFVWVLGIQDWYTECCQIRAV